MSAEIITPSTTPEIDRSVFDKDRFAKKIGNWFVTFLFILMFIGLCAYSASLTMNSFIYKPPVFRFLMGIFGAIFSIPVIGYMIWQRYAVGQSAVPFIWATFPLATAPYEWDISNFLFKNSTVWTPDHRVLDAMNWLQDTPDAANEQPYKVMLSSLKL